MVAGFVAKTNPASVVSKRSPPHNCNAAARSSNTCMMYPYNKTRQCIKSPQARCDSRQSLEIQL